MIGEEEAAAEVKVAGGEEARSACFSAKFMPQQGAPPSLLEYLLPHGESNKFGSSAREQLCSLPAKREYEEEDEFEDEVDMGVQSRARPRVACASLATHQKCGNSRPQASQASPQRSQMSYR